jgi:hypothetical protein
MFIYKQSEKLKLNEELGLSAHQLEESIKKIRALDDKHGSIVAQLDEHRKSNAELVFKMC